MKCQILFSGKNKKNMTNLLSADLAQRIIRRLNEKDLFEHIQNSLVQIILHFHTVSSSTNTFYSVQ